jgi:hypothetical protein
MAITADDAIRRNESEKAAIEEAGAVATIFTGSDQRPTALFNAFVARQSRILQLRVDFGAPLIICVTSTSATPLRPPFTQHPSAP